jgi:hypothetical protein
MILVLTASSTWLADEARLQLLLNCPWGACAGLRVADGDRAGKPWEAVDVVVRRLWYCITKIYDAPIRTSTGQALYSAASKVAYLPYLCLGVHHVRCRCYPRRAESLGQRPARQTI